MVRKMQLKRIDDELSRQLSYAKRRNGLIKKALELNKICGVDCLFISFSPSGRLSYFSGDQRVEDVLARFATIPDHIRRYYLSDHEFQEFLAILNELKTRTDLHLQNDRTFVAIQREILRVKAELQSLTSELSKRFEPLPESIMTIEEANNSEAVIEETLAKVQDRMKELSEKQENDATDQPSGSMTKAENAPKNELKNPSDEAQLVEPELQPSNDDSDNNNNDLTPNHSPEPDRERSTYQNMLTEVNSPNSGSSFSSLLMYGDAPETLSPVMNPSMPTLPTSQPPNQNTGISFLPNRSFLFDSVLNGRQNYLNAHPPEGTQALGQSGSTYRTPTSSGFIMIPNSSLHSQNPYHLHPSNPNAVPPAQSPYYQIPSQMPLGESRLPLYNGPQWTNQNNLQPNQTLFGQRGGYLDMTGSVSEINSMYPIDPASPAAAFFRSQNQPMNNYQLGIPGHQLNALQGPHEAVGSTSSSNKRRAPWDQDDSVLRLSNNHSMNAAPNSVSLTPRHSTNAVYNVAYEMMGLPIDPHLRMMEEMARKEGSGSSQQQPPPPPPPNQ